MKLCQFYCLVESELRKNFLTLKQNLKVERSVDFIMPSFLIVKVKLSPKKDKTANTPFQLFKTQVTNSTLDV